MIRRIGWLVFFFSMFYGCQISNSSSDQPEPVLFGKKFDFKNQNTFQKILALEPRTVQYEQAKIEHLIDRLYHSDYQFIRNGEIHSAKRGAIHLKWKYWKRRKRIQSAQSFVDEIGSASSLSGKPYLVQISAAKTVNCGGVLQQELDLLENAIASYREAQRLNPQGKVDKAGESSLESQP